jgi:hypothetical protein
MRKIKLFEDGNLRKWIRLNLIVIGFAIMYGTMKFVPPSLWGGLLLILGFGVALVGGMTSRAALLKIKPFDNSYKKARKSYEMKYDDSEKSE